MTTAKWLAYNSADTLIQGAAMNALGGSGSFAITGQSSGTPIDNTSGLYLYMDVILTLSTNITAGAGSPYVGVYLIPSLDLTNYPTPPGNPSSAPTAIPSNYFVGSIPAVASASFTSGVLRGVVLTPGKFIVAIQNNLGAAFPSTNTSTCQGYRYGEQAV